MSLQIKDFEYTESFLKKERIKTPKAGTIISIVLLLLQEAKDLLFSNGKYKPLKWYRPRRIWQLAQIALRLINSILTVTRT
tara:strand:+ start:19 stop:261 length:243 start_codon:yes stop_codon:yes gene_type:complete